MNKKRSEANWLTFLKETGNLFKNLFRKDFINHSIITQPEDLRKKVLLKNIFSFVINSILFTAFSYLILAGNYAIEHKAVKWGIFLYLFNECQHFLRLFYIRWERNKLNEIDFSQIAALTEKTNILLSKANWNVYQQEGTRQRQSSNEEISNSITRYLKNLWEIQNNYWFNIGKAFVAIAMFIGTIITNTVIPQSQFILLMLLSCAGILGNSAFDLFYWKKLRKRDRELENQKFMIKNDMLRVVPIIDEDSKARTRKYQNLCHQHFWQQKRLIKKDIFSDLLTSIIHIAASTFLIIAYTKNYEEITLATAAGITATLAIFNKAISLFSDFIMVLDICSRKWQELDQEKEMMEEILRVYNKKMIDKPQELISFPIEKFEITYKALSENDIPFKLILDEETKFNPGDCVALTGASGSGKSTFLKVITSRITFKKQEKDTGKIAPINYTFYDETVDFGSSCLWDELFCLDDTEKSQPTQEELDKMLEILKGMQLYTEISENCKDFWVWMKENTARTLSKGQKQRMIVAKILFWLNDRIDIVALDECTSGLDAEASNDQNNPDALNILKFIIDYCNPEHKKRIIFLATHQNIDSLCNHKLHFKRTKGITKIQKVC